MRVSTFAQKPDVIMHGMCLMELLPVFEQN